MRWHEINEAAKTLRIYHGSRSGKTPMPDGRRPFYGALEPDMAQTYADLHNAGHVVAYDVDTTGFINADDYEGVLDSVYPEEGWIDHYPSTAATVDDPKILTILKQRGVRGIVGLWDFGMDERMERRVVVVLDPKSLTPVSV